MSRKRIDRTISSHTDNKKFTKEFEEKHGRETQVRRDNDNLVAPVVTLETIDSAVIHYIQKEIQPTVISNNKQIKVPVLYASGERWNDLKRLGYFRDNDNKVFPPLLTIRRNSINLVDSLRKNEVLRDKVNNYQMVTKYNQVSRYDQFSVLKGQRPKKERYYVNIPDFIDIDYEVKMWTDKTFQINELAELMMFHKGKAFGDKNGYKFISVTDAINFETVNTQGEDRLVSATLSLKTRAFLIPKNDGLQSNLKKGITIGKIQFNTKVVDNMTSVNGLSQTAADELEERRKYTSPSFSTTFSDGSNSSSGAGLAGTIAFGNISVYQSDNTIVNIPAINRNDTLLISGSGFNISASVDERKITLVPDISLALPGGVVSGSQQITDYGFISSSVLNVDENGIIRQSGLQLSTITSDTEILSVDKTQYRSLHLNYNIRTTAGGAFRAGNVIFIWDDTADRVNYTDTHTEDIGWPTTNVTFSGSIVGSEFKAFIKVAGSTWDVRMGGTLL